MARFLASRAKRCKGFAHTVRGHNRRAGFSTTRSSSKAYTALGSWSRSHGTGPPTSVAGDARRGGDGMPAQCGTRLRIYRVDVDLLAWCGSVINGPAGSGGMRKLAACKNGLLQRDALRGPVRCRRQESFSTIPALDGYALGA